MKRRIFLKTIVAGGAWTIRAPWPCGAVASQPGRRAHPGLMDRLRDTIHGWTESLWDDARAVGQYNLPVTVGRIQIDCPVTKGHLERSVFGNIWALDADVRLRIWPAGSFWLEPATFTYPVRQRWFASDTQMANEPVFVDGPERPANKRIYYHYGLDLGGAEALTEVVSATDGVVVSSGERVLEPAEYPPIVEPRFDVVYVRDQRGWYYRYAHLYSIDPTVTVGAPLTVGQRIGLLGKEASSGAWSHLHFDISGMQPSGRYGIVEGYAFLWEAYVDRYKPVLQAVARPHHVAWSAARTTVARPPRHTFTWSSNRNSEVRSPGVL